MGTTCCQYLIALGVAACAGLSGPAHAQSLLNDSHSVESIRAAISSPLPPQVIEQARRADDTLLRTGKNQGQDVYLVQDARTDRVANIATRLLAAAGQDPGKWSVRVLGTQPPTENAFVNGGPFIYVFTGLVDRARTDDELAFVLGHEIAHSLLKQNLRRSQDFTQLLGSIAALSGVLTRDPTKKDKRQLIAGAFGGAYSRQDEQEADAYGAHLAFKAGYNPLAGVNFFRRLATQESQARSRNDFEIATAKRQVESQVARCEQMRGQLAADPRLRTQQNVNNTNMVCAQASQNVTAFNNAMSTNSREESRSALLATHPLNEDRINALIVINDYLRGRRSLDSLGSIGQGQRVFVALGTSTAGAAVASPAVAPPAAPGAGGFAPESRRAGESCNSNSDCAGELRCERAMCSATDSAAAAAAFTTPATGGAFRPESRMAGETCNSNSDCNGTLRCETGLCRP
ncbi:M48 family metallopeptidase [Variovorax sp. VNK109]|uniref:M48 family metallopeptidase n=1 Tax=Variovorax sp. VNK109 TaxID=3400919 RepID=UPI003C0EC19A